MRKKQSEEFELDPWKLFLNAMRSPLTKDRYQTRVAKFFDFIGISGNPCLKWSYYGIFKEKGRKKSLIR